MNKLKIILTIIFFTSILVLPIKTNALNINDYIYIGENTQEVTCEPDDSLLGSVNDENSVAWLFQQALNYIKVIGPLLVVVLSSIDFAKDIIHNDDEELKKTENRLVTRIILALSLFVLPSLVSALLSLFGITSNATCGLE